MAIKRRSKQNPVNASALAKLVVDLLVFVGNAVISITFPLRTFMKNTKDLKPPHTMFLDLFYNLSSLSRGFLRPKRRRGRPRTRNAPVVTIRKAVGWFFIGGVFSVSIVAGFQTYGWYKRLPKPEILGENVGVCTKIFDRKSRLLYQICPEKRTEPVSLSNVSLHMKNATIAIEDSQFYSHNGFRLTSIARAAYQTLFRKNTQGGSTITQQLVKLLLLSPERTYERKIKELLLSILVERKFTKDKILEMYLNNAPYGGNVVGVESASRKFFGKSSAELDLSEASLLAALPSAPSVYSPFTAFNLAKNRQYLVLDRMVAQGYIAEAEAEEAFKKEIDFVEQVDYIRAPHFVDYVREGLEKLYGRRYSDFGGLTVTTTLDLDIQDMVQGVIRDEVEKNGYLNITNGAAVVLDSQSGEILAMVGSKDYFDKENDGVFNVATSERQPGSSIKPVTYSLALINGYKASSLIDDSPIVINTGTEVYRPVNYDGQFHGKVTLRQALANSYNIAAVNVLRKLDIDEMVELGKKMGLTTWEADGNYGLSITLGGRETRLLDLTNVFATLARSGRFTPTNAFLSIRDSKGYEIFKEGKTDSQVLPEEVAYIITDILSDYYARLPAFGTNNYLSIKGHTVAVKTGTTDNKRDNYTVGYTPSYTVGVWVGNNDNSPMNQSLASGLTGAAPAWNSIMSGLLKDSANENFVKPENVVVRTYSECGNAREVYIKGTEPSKLDCLEKKNGREKDDEKDKKKERG